MDNENFLTEWTEYDPEGGLALTADEVDFLADAGLPENSDCWLQRQANSPSCFQVDFELEVPSILGATTDIGIWGAATVAPTVANATPEIGLRLKPVGGTDTYQLELFCTSLAATDTSAALTAGQPAFAVIIHKQGTLLTADWDAAAQHPALTVVCGSGHFDYRWVAYVKDWSADGAEEDFAGWTEVDTYNLLTVAADEAECVWDSSMWPPPPMPGPDFAPAFLHKALPVSGDFSALVYFSHENTVADTLANDNTLLGWDNAIPNGGNGVVPGNRPELDFFLQANAGANALFVRCQSTVQTSAPLATVAGVEYRATVSRVGSVFSAVVENYVNVPGVGWQWSSLGTISVACATASLARTWIALRPEQDNGVSTLRVGPLSILGTQQVTIGPMSEPSGYC